jgi:hypothetical protein
VIDLFGVSKITPCHDAAFIEQMPMLRFDATLAPWLHRAGRQSLIGTSLSSRRLVDLFYPIKMLSLSSATMLASGIGQRTDSRRDRLS